MLLAQDEQQAQDMAGLTSFLNELLELKVEDVKTKLWCEIPLKTEPGRCENEAFVTFVRDVPQRPKVEDVKIQFSSVVVVVMAVVVTVVGDSGGYDVIAVVVSLVATVSMKKMNVREFRLILLDLKVSEVSHPLLENHLNTMNLRGT